MMERNPLTMSRGQAGAACRRENADHPSEGGKALANNDSFLTYSDPRLLTKSVRASAMVFEDPLSRAPPIRPAALANSSFSADDTALSLDSRAALPPFRSIN